jgi:hypothetical protein
MEIEYIPEENQEEIKIVSKPKLIKKTQLGKKRALNKEKSEIREPNDTNRNILSQNNDSNAEEVIIIRNEPFNLNKNGEDNNASFLMKTIFKAFYLSLWKRQVKAMKYYSRSYNPQRINFKKLIKEISSVIKQHKLEYFNEICENINNLPMPKNVNHDYNFGTLRIIDKEMLYKKYSDKIALLAENNYNKKINGLKYYLIEAFKKMGKIREIYGQIYLNENKETEYSNFDKYLSYNNTQVSKEDEENISPNYNNLKRMKN